MRGAHFQQEGTAQLAVIICALKLYILLGRRNPSCWRKAQLYRITGDAVPHFFWRCVVVLLLRC